MNEQEKLQAINDLVKSQSTVALSTVGVDGLPNVAPLFYWMGADLELYWFSSTSSAHSRNIALLPQASGAIYVATERWSEICGVQMRGTVDKIIDRALRRQISQAYRDRFHLGNVFRVAIAKSSLYRFRPHWIRYLDNTRHFGFKFEVTLSTSQVQEKH